MSATALHSNTRGLGENLSLGISRRGRGAEDLEGEISHAEVRRRGEKETERLDWSRRFAFQTEGRIWKTNRTKGDKFEREIGLRRL